jgi:hypothetical protein
VLREVRRLRRFAFQAIDREAARSERCRCRAQT